MPAAPRPNNKATRIAAIVLGYATEKEKKKGVNKKERPPRNDGLRTT